MKSEVVFQAADLGEQFTARWSLAGPDFIHPVCHVVPHIGDDEVSCFMRAEFLLLGLLPDGLALG